MNSRLVSCFTRPIAAHIMSQRAMKGLGRRETRMLSQQAQQLFVSANQ